MFLTPRSLRDPLALVVLGAGGVTTVVGGVWWMAPLTLVGYLLVAANTESPPPPVITPRPEVDLDGDYAKDAKRLETLARRITEAVQKGAPVVQACFDDTPREAHDLVRHCRLQIAKRARLDGFLAAAIADDPEGEQTRLREALSAATDAEVRSRYAKALDHAASRLADLERIRRNLARMIADQAEVENGLQNVLSRIVSLDSVDEAQLTGMSGEVGQVLGELQLRISASERMLDQTGDLAATAITRTPAPPVAF